MSEEGEAGTSEGASVDVAEDGYVDFRVAGDPAVGEFRCSDCSYGVAVHRTLPRCPMCGGTTWERSPWSPLSPRFELSREG